MAGKVGRRVYKTRQWKNARWGALVRAGFQCSHCGRRVLLEVHHVRRVITGKDWFDPSNLKVLCKSCHLRTHKNDTRKMSEDRRELLALAETNT